MPNGFRANSQVKSPTDSELTEVSKRDPDKDPITNAATTNEVISAV